MNLPSAAVGYYAQWWAATSTMIPVSWGAGYFYSFCPLPELHAALQWHLVTWWHLYLSIILFPPLVLRSLKVTSVWLQLQTSPMYFIAEPYIWTPLISPVLRPPARLTPSILILGLSHPHPQHFSQQRFPQAPSRTESAHTGQLKRLLGTDFISSRLSIAQNQISIKSGPLRDALWKTFYRRSFSS